MRKLPLVLAMASFVLSLVIFIFAEGARSIYSGAFFALIGVVLLLNARRRQPQAPE